MKVQVNRVRKSDTNIKFFLDSTELMIAWKKITTFFKRRASITL